MKRNRSVDVLRVMLMFGICLLHSITKAGHNVAWAANMLAWCVPGFVFISGWFGIRFSIGKVLKLYGISIYCAATFCCFDMLCVGGMGSIFDVALRIWQIAIGQWFLNAYAVLMCFAPLLNEACAVVAERWVTDRRAALMIVLPLMLCAFGWSFALTLPIVPRYIPSSTGLMAYSFMTLIGVYVVARMMRELDNRERLCAPSRKILLAIACACLPFAAIGFGDYNSPFAVIIAACAFLLLRTLSVPVWLGRACVWLAPSMFSVYLIHSHGKGWRYLAIVEDAALAFGLPLPAAYLLTAICVFAVCIAMDVPRRLFARIYGIVRMS